MQRAILLAPIPPRSRYTLYCCPSCDIYQPTGYRLLSPPPESIFRTGVMRARALPLRPPAETGDFIPILKGTNFVLFSIISVSMSNRPTY